jgi:deoxyribose-phosphate aldolase
MATSRLQTLLVSLPELAKMIDHSLIHPTMADSDVSAGLQT